MQYLLLIYEDESVWTTRSEADNQAMMGAYFKYTEELKAAGVYRAGEALQPIASATTVRVRGGRTTTTDGPFAETKEQLGGFYLIDAPTLDEALHWAARLPASATGSVEVRPIMSFG
ncbi:MAG: YciI family protein [Myxococcota bacterium]